MSTPRTVSEEDLHVLQVQVGGVERGELFGGEGKGLRVGEGGHDDELLGRALNVPFCGMDGTCAALDRDVICNPASLRRAPPISGTGTWALWSTRKAMRERQTTLRCQRSFS
jgi:hypothetical protein